jgi:hypothetical protein
MAVKYVSQDELWMLRAIRTACRRATFEDCEGCMFLPEEGIGCHIGGLPPLWDLDGIEPGSITPGTITPEEGDRVWETAMAAWGRQ